MRRTLATLIALLLLLCIGIVVWLGTTQSGLRWVYQQAVPYLPGELTLKQLEGRLLGEITLKGIEYQHNGTLIKSDQLIVEWHPSALLAASIDISRLHIQNLRIVLPATEKIEQSVTLPAIYLPWRLELEDVVIDNLSISQNEQTYPLKQVSLKASNLFSQLDIRELGIHGDTFNLNINGRLQPTGEYHHNLNIRWQAELPSSAVIQGSGQLQGDMKMSHIKQVLGGPLQLSLDAELRDILNQFNWQARVNVSEFDASKMDGDWPDLMGKLTLDGSGDLTTATLTGTLSGDYRETGPFNADFKLQRLGDNTIQVERLTLLSPLSETRINAQGKWVPGSNGGDIALNMDWQDLRWPLKEQYTPWFHSTKGAGRIEGNIDHYRFELDTDRPWPQAPPSNWHANGEGNLEGLDVQLLRVTALDGEASAKGRLTWSPRLAWQADVNATGINPASLLPQWPGQLNATMTSRGHFENGQLSVDTDITQLTGRLRGYPVSLRSKLGWHDEALNINLFDFHSGTSRLSIQGRVDETLKLDWTIDATDLAQLYPQANGQLQARGVVTGPRKTPLINTSFNGKSLSLMDYHVGSLVGTLSMDFLQWQRLKLNLSAKALELEGYLIQSLEISSHEQRITVNAISEELTALVELTGKVDAQGWHGEIERADLNSQKFHNWRLKRPAALHITADTVEATSLCWQSHDSEICMALQREEDNQWQATLNAGNLPLTLLAPLLPEDLGEDLGLEGVANAKADFRLQSSRISGGANIQIQPGSVSYLLPDGEREQWGYRGGSVIISLDDQGIQAETTLTIRDDDKLYIKAELPGAQFLSLDREHQKLLADVELTVTDLGLIEALIPDIQDLKGQVTFNLSASGTMSQPRLNGRAQLLNGTLQIPRLGLSINHITLQSQSDGLKELNYHLDASSGTGKLTIEGNTTLDSAAGWPTVINIKGDQFEVSRIPEAWVQVSPNLQVNLKNRTIDIQGDVHIPYAKLQPRDITTATRVSQDAVIIGSEQVQKEKWSIFNRTRLTLGDRVNFYGFGFEGRFGGNILLVDEPGQLTKSTGEITVHDGYYRAYGQRLEVEQGRLLYAGGPLMNPGLDLRAVRHVGDITTGLKVRGTLNQPQVELFSVPAMGQTNTLAYLLLGRPIESASGEDGAMMAQAALALGLSEGDRLARSLGERFGLDEMRVESSDSGDQASLVVGRYLSPKLYVSYGVGLIETINTFAVRYQISDKWQLKGESGESQGADILYTIER